MAKAVTNTGVYNNTQNFYPADGNWQLEKLPFVASVAITDGTAVGIQISTNTTTGRLTKMGVENAAGADFIGILAEPIATTDSDYATAGKLKSVWVPMTLNAKAYFKVKSGTFTAVDVFKTVEIHSDADGLAVDTPGKGARIVEYISSTKGKCVFSLPATETA